MIVTHARASTTRKARDPCIPLREPRVIRKMSRHELRGSRNLAHITLRTHFDALSVAFCTVMKLGIHLPIIDFGDGTPNLSELVAYVREARALGFSTIATNDHLIWHRPWLDGPAALTAVAEAAGDLALATVTLPVVRHPVPVAKTVGALAVLTESRVIAALIPGSSSADFAALGVPFEQRWARFDESFAVVRALLAGDPAPPGVHYELDDVVLDPVPKRRPEVWLATWGSETRLRRLAPSLDGWLASGYNTTPERWTEGRARLDDHLRAAERDPQRVPDAIGTVFWHMTDRAAEAAEVAEMVGAALRRDPSEIASRLPIGSPQHCAEILAAYAEAGAQELFVWPLRDRIAQLGGIAECGSRVLPEIPMRRM